MRVHANRDSALVLAAQASKAVPKITTIPELKGIHMEADARLAMLTMTATNQEVSIRASMPAAVEESGSAVIPADLLPDILKRLPGDQVSFSTVGPGIIHIGSGYAEYRLNILDAAKYPLPEVPFLEDTIPVSGICSLARQTLFAAAAGDQQNILKTVRLKVPSVPDACAKASRRWKGCVRMEGSIFHGNSKHLPLLRWEDHQVHDPRPLSQGA